MSYNTKQKSAIKNILLQNKDKMISADEIIKELESLGESVGKTTLYRFLDELVLIKEIRKYYNNNSNKYEYQLINNTCLSHLHLKCINCGMVIHLDDLHTSSLVKEVEENYNFFISQEQTTILGLCKNCRG